MASFYNDDQWAMFNPASGKINVTTTKEACAAAARPDVDPKYRNYCVQCELSYMDRSTVQTYVLPVSPVPAQRAAPVRRGGSGVALNGVRIDGPAPTHAILGAHTLAPFDDCGGHVNLHVGYHYHALTGCSTEAPASDAATSTCADCWHCVGWLHDAQPFQPRWQRADRPGCLSRPRGGGFGLSLPCEQSGKERHLAVPHGPTGLCK